MRPASLSLALLLLLAPEAPALRLMTYNALNYSYGRTTQFQIVLQETQPELLVVEEISLAGTVNFLAILNSVNPGEWSVGPFVDGPDTDNAIFYRSAACSVVSHFVIDTALRDIDEWTVRPSSHETSAADLRLYALHLKASQGSDNETKRRLEVQAMRVRMETYPAGQDYAVLGDFNIYNSTEPAYQYMIQPTNGVAGVVQDPIDREGNWHVNPLFADIHTQSTRTTQFGGGANGGMDDRFDMLLVSPASESGEGWDILDSTYTAFGQDGQHFDVAINIPPFTVVTQTVAQALHDASDHLPVFADWQVPARIATVASLDVGTVIVGGTTGVDLSVENVAQVPGDELDYSLSAPPGFTAPAGAFLVDAGAAPALHLIGLDGGTVGFHSGDLTIATDDPDDPIRLVALTGTVLDHARPSTEDGVIQLVAAVDFATLPAGTTGVAVEVHNFGWNALQAGLEAHDAQLVGDPRFFLPSFAPVPVEGTPGWVDVAFDADGAAEGIHTATLTVLTRDRTDLAGWSDLEDLTFDLSVLVGAVDAPISATLARTGITTIGPNPFRSGAEIGFGLASAARVDLVVYDVRGRLVRSLQSGIRPAGEHRIRWDGRDPAGRPLAPGIYFVRFTAGEVTETRKLVRIR